MANVLSACQVSSGNDICGSHGKKIIYFGVLIVFFCRGTHECYSLMKLGRHLKHLSFFATKLFLNYFWTFLDFTINGGSVRAKTWMGTFQHFFHECKWHWHIGDVFLNILVSYLHFSDLVWISYEVFKLTVKRLKGKSIRGAKLLGQNRWILEIMSKTNEWDTTRGINLIIPWIYIIKIPKIFILSYYLFQISLSQVAVKGLTTPLSRCLRGSCLFG